MLKLPADKIGQGMIGGGMLIVNSQRGGLSALPQLAVCVFAFVILGIESKLFVIESLGQLTRGTGIVRSSSRVTMQGRF